jgi:DedD protein
MADEPEGVSTRQLLAAFFAVVVLCAVFFSLGFFLGHRERAPESNLSAEQVPSSSSDAPAAVNPSQQQSPSDPSASPGSATDASNQAAGAGAPSPDAASGSSAQSTPAETPALDTPPREERVSGESAPAATAQPAAFQTSAGTPAGKLPPGLLVQVAALTNQQDANDMIGVLQSRGYPALILTPQQARSADTLFRVVAGPYQTRADAEAARSKLAAAGFKPFIRR